MLKAFALLGLPLLLAACHQTPAPERAVSTTAAQGFALAQTSCAQCHAIRGPGTSPNSSAIPFPAIVNKEGLTRQTLSTWLRGAHNYPKEMDFFLGDKEVDRLVAYMLTLKDPNYKRPPD